MVDPVITGPAAELVVVAVVVCGNMKPVFVGFVAAEPAVAPRVPVHTAPVGQQAISFAASCVHIVPGWQQTPELPWPEQAVYPARQLPCRFRS